MAYMSNCPTWSQCHECYQSFKSRRISTEDDSKSGRPLISMDDDHAEKVSSVICANWHLTVCEVSNEAGICKSLCHMILKERLNMHRVDANFVRCLLIDEKKKKNSVTVSQELFDCSNADENFLKNVVTGDKIWIYGYNVKTKGSHHNGLEQHCLD